MCSFRFRGKGLVHRTCSRSKCSTWLCWELSKFSSHSNISHQKTQHSFILPSTNHLLRIHDESDEWEIGIPKERMVGQEDNSVTQQRMTSHSWSLLEQTEGSWKLKNLLVFTSIDCFMFIWHTCGIYLFCLLRSSLVWF